MGTLAALSADVAATALEKEQDCHRYYVSFFGVGFMGSLNRAGFVFFLNR